MRDLRGLMFQHLLVLPTAFFHDQHSGGLLAKLTYDVEQVADASTNSVTILVRDSFTTIGLLGWMFWLSPRLTLTFLIMGPVIGVLVVQISRRFRRLSRHIQTSVGDITQIAGESIEGHGVVKIFGGADYESQRFAAVNERNRRQVMRYMATNASSAPVTQLVASLALAMVIYLATLPGLMEAISVGTFMSFMAAMMLLLPAMKHLTTVNANIQRGIAAGQSVFDLLAHPPEADKGQATLVRARGQVEYRGVSFGYPAGAKLALEEINLRVEPGETVALVGRSGSGKTTLASLLPRFYDLSTGDIYLDGHDIRELSLTSLREQLALVSQHVTLFNDTIANNIAYGRLGRASREAIIEAAQDAGAMDFINALPAGLDTLVGENGVRLSGGQRQRLAIARALLKDAPVLILDEATSALDSESERHIQHALERLMRRRTTLVIAHRLSTIEGADRIVVLDQGRIVETGNHATLLALDGHYAALHRLQFRDSATS